MTDTTSHHDPLDPRYVQTTAAKQLLERPVFAGYYARGNRHNYLGDHIAVNAHDLASVETEAFERGRASVRRRVKADERQA